MAEQMTMPVGATDGRKPFLTKPIVRPRCLPRACEPFPDLDWVRDVCRKYAMDSLVPRIRPGIVWVNPHLRCYGGRCWYIDGGFVIEISGPRLRLDGKDEIQDTLAHELLHAWLYVRYGRKMGHGPVFMAAARSRGIGRYCQGFQAVGAKAQLDRFQMRLTADPERQVEWIREMKKRSEEPPKGRLF